MKTKHLSMYLLLIFAGIVIAAASPEPTMYVGSNPCGTLLKQMMHVPVEKKCDMMKWELLLYPGFKGDHPAYFTLNYKAGLSKNGTRGLQPGAYASKLEGVWTPKAKPKGLPGRDVIVLEAKTGEKLTFIRLDDNVLHLLDPDKKMMIGNGAFGYTFNKR